MARRKAKTEEATTEEVVEPTIEEATTEEVVEPTIEEATTEEGEENADEQEGEEEQEAEEEVQLNKDGFPIGQPVEFDKILRFQSEQRKKSKVIPKASKALASEDRLAQAKAKLLAEAQAEVNDD